MESGKASLDFADRPVFAAVIQPHRSLDRNGLRTVMALCCACPERALSLLHACAPERRGC